MVGAGSLQSPQAQYQAGMEPQCDRLPCAFPAISWPLRKVFGTNSDLHTLFCVTDEKGVHIVLFPEILPASGVAQTDRDFTAEFKAGGTKQNTPPDWSCDLP